MSKKILPQGESQGASNGAQHQHSPTKGQNLTRATIRAACQCGQSGCECQTDHGHVHCPAHSDTKPSLSVDERDGKTLFVCRSGCTQEVVLAALRARTGTSKPNTKSGTKNDNGAAPSSLGAKAARFDWKRATIYAYTDEAGALLFQVGRQGDGAAKQFRQRCPDGRGGWLHSLEGVRRVLYRLPDVLAAQTVFVCEGEKAADALNAALGEAKLFGEFAATCNPHGAGAGANKWRDEYSTTLTGKTVYIFPDNDAPGRDHAQAVAGSVAPVAVETRVVELPDQREKDGADDWLNRGRVIGELLEIAEAAPLWAPSATPAAPVENTPDTSKPIQSPEEIRAAFKSATSKAAPGLALDELIVQFRKAMFVKDDGAIKIALATFVANLCDGDPVWLMFIGGPSSGKTETVSPLAALPFARLVGTFTESALLSGTAKRDKAKDASGGLLRELGSFGVLILKDFTSILSMHHDKRVSVLAALREIYDGVWVRDVGAEGARKLEWRGKLGIIGCCTDAIESAHAISGAMGERFMRYRLQHDTDDQKAMTRHALRRAGHDAKMRADLEQAVMGFFGALEIPVSPDPLTEAEEDRLIAIAMLTAKARSVVDRDAKGREIELVHDAEIPTRLAMMLRRVLHGLRIIGVSEPEAWHIIQKAALDSIPKLRAEIIGLVARELDVPTAATLTAKAIVTALDSSAQATRRALEELRAHGVLTDDDTIIGGNKVAVWKFSDLGKALWEEGFSAFPVKSQHTHTNGFSEATPSVDLILKSTTTCKDDFTGKADFEADDTADDAIFGGMEVSE